MEHSPRNGTRRERKRDTADQGKQVGAEPRKGRQNKTSHRKSDEIAAAKMPGNNAMDETDGVCLAIPASSPPQTASQQVDEKATGTPNPNATSTGPAVPAGMSHTQPDKPLEERAGTERVEKTHLKDEKAVETAGEERRKAAEDETAGAECLGIEATDSNSEAPSDGPTETDSRGEGGDIEVDHTEATPQETCSEDDEVKNVSEMSQPRSERTHQNEAASIARQHTNPTTPEDPAETMGDDQRHPIVPTEPPEVAKSARVDQDMSRVEMDELKEVVPEDLGEDDDDVAARRPTKPSQTPNAAKEAADVPCAAEEAHREPANPPYDAEEGAQECDQSAKPPHHAEEGAQAHSRAHQPREVEVEAGGKTIHDEMEGVTYRDADAQGTARMVDSPTTTVLMGRVVG